MTVYRADILKPDIVDIYVRVENTLEKPFDFAAEAAACGITLRHWNRLFTAGTGMPPHRMLLQCRIRKACRLLAATNLSIKEISDRCGFASPAEFSRSFRKHIGMTAAGYRRTRFL